MTETIDFLGIGAKKAATSWLWQNLREHPEIWLPPKKELHYFDRSTTYPSPSYLATDHVLARIFGIKYCDREFRKNFTENMNTALRKKNWKRARWLLHYYLGNYNDEWYRSLFDNGTGKLKGEITPSYALLDEADVKRISNMFPDLKIIFLLRNPVDRAWAQVRYDWTRSKFSAIHDNDRIKEEIESRGQILRSDYLRTLDIWSAHFPEKNIFIGFFDDVVQSSQSLVRDVLEFLEVKNPGYSKKKKLEKKVKVSRPMEFPAEIKLYLSRKYLPDLQALSERVGGHAVDWLAQAEQILQNEGETPENTLEK